MLSRFINTIKNLRLSFDRSFSSSVWRQVIWLLAFVLISSSIILLIGMFCPSAYEASNNEGFHGILFDTFFLMLDPGSLTESMSPWYATIVAIFGIIVFTGMFISVFSSMLVRRVNNYLNGNTRYRLKNHVIIFGYDDTVPSLIKSISNRTGENQNVPSDSWIVIASNADSQEVRNKVTMHTTKDEEERVIIFHCHRTEKEDLLRLCLDQCNLIYIVGEQNEAGHDGNNLECINLLGSILSAPKKCFVHFNSMQVLSECRRRDLSKLIQGKALMYPYNYYDTWAKKLLIYGPNDSKSETKYYPIDAYKMQHDSKKFVHLFIFGMSEMGKAISIQAAQIAHFPNFRINGETKRTRITFVDKDIKDKQAEYMQCYHQYFNLTRTRYCCKYAELSDNVQWEDPMTETDSPFAYMGENFIDQEWEFIDGSANDKNISRYISRCANDKDQICTLYFCGDNEDKNIEDVIALDEEVIEASNQVLVYQRNSSWTIENMTNKEKVRPFGMMDSIFGEKLIEENCACMINAKYNAINQGEELKDYSKDKIVQLWYNTPIEKKWASIHQTNTRFIILRSAGVQMNPTMEEAALSIEKNLPYLKEAEHNRWMVERLLLGLRPYTETEYEDWSSKSPEQQKEDCIDKKREKIHMCIRPTKSFSKEMINATGINTKNDEEILKLIPTLLFHPIDIF